MGNKLLFLISCQNNLVPEDPALQKKYLCDW